MSTPFELNVNKTVNDYNMIQQGDHIIVGISGGADSVSLLIYLHSIINTLDLTITAVHINHGIRGDEALRDEIYVKKLCDNLNIECIIFKKDIRAIAKDKKISEELAGRQERYNAFNEVCKSLCADKIAVAHTKNDSAETVLMKLTRGCSLNGLRGISPTNGNVIRPLINTSRQDIETYLEQKKLEYMTDSTNNENIYTRNIVRNSVIPLLEQINPGFINTVCSNSQNIVCDDDFIEECASKHYDDCVSLVDGVVAVDLSKLSALHLALKKRILIHAYSLINGDKTNIEHKHIDILLNCSGTGKLYELGNNITAETTYGKLVLKNKKNNSPRSLL